MRRVNFTAIGGGAGESKRRQAKVQRAPCLLPPVVLSLFSPFSPTPYSNLSQPTQKCQWYSDPVRRCPSTVRRLLFSMAPRAGNRAAPPLFACVTQDRWSTRTGAPSRSTTRMSNLSCSRSRRRRPRYALFFPPLLLTSLTLVTLLFCFGFRLLRRFFVLGVPRAA